MGEYWDERCHYIPWINDQDELATLYRACDVMSYPSQPLPGNIIEQYGFVFPEALFSNIPIVAPSAGAGPEFVFEADGLRSGIVVEHSNAEALYTGLKKVLFTEYNQFIGDISDENHGKKVICEGWINFMKEKIGWTNQSKNTN
jgi:glycosyltransferase involved in cell wall biosynthesis